MATGFVEVARRKLRGILADMSSATDAQTAISDNEETVSQLTRIAMTFDLAETTATGVASSQRRPLPGNGNFRACSGRIVIATGALAQSSTDYATVTLNHLADGAATVKTAVAAFTTSTGTANIGDCRALTITGANQMLSGGSLRVDVTKAGDGQTVGVHAVTIEIERRDD